MIDQPTIDRILDAANIVDVVSEFVTLRKRGINYVGIMSRFIRTNHRLFTYPPQRISVSVSLAEKVEPPFTSS